MVDTDIGFISCSLLGSEVQAVVQRLGLEHAPRVSFASDCHAPSARSTWPPLRVQEQLARCSSVVALCMNCRRPGSGAGAPACSVSSFQHPRLELVSVESHGELFLGREATSRALADGAFLVLPGWLSRWRHIVVDCWRFDAPTARSFFAESASKLLLLDTGCGEDWEPRLQAMSEYVGLPVERRFVGTSHLEVLVERALVRDEHRREKALGVRTLSQTRAQAAEYATVVDFITGLGSLPTPAAIIAALEDVARMLFAPREARFHPSGYDQRPAGGDDSFAVDVCYQDTRLGMLVVLGIAMPEHKERYLPMARAVVDAAGIALHASRLLERERELSRQLKRKVAELDQFAYIASHDLQAPLRRTVSFAELLLEACGDQLPDRAHLYLQHIQRNALLMRSLVQDLLRLSRAGNNPLKLEPVDLDACLQRALVALGGPIEQTGATVLREPLPQVSGDAGLLSQLFQNLVGNALKFVPSGRTPSVTIGAARDGDRWVISVADNGIGIDLEHAATIFQPFQRLHRTGEYEGTGMGLAICAKVVERHGGRIAVEPGPAGGSVFRIALPASVPPTLSDQECQP